MYEGISSSIHYWQRAALNLVTLALRAWTISLLREYLPIEDLQASVLPDMLAQNAVNDFAGFLQLMCACGHVFMLL